MTAIIRQASHAGSWYSGEPARLRNQLQNWLDGAAMPSDREDSRSLLQAIIVPHAGFAYSGKTAAQSYRALRDRVVPAKRIFILGPSHHFYLEGFALSQCTEYETPLGHLAIDQECCSALSERYPLLFRRRMSKACDEDEHSLEMQLPFIYCALCGDPDVKIVPILVGQLTAATSLQFAEALLPYFQSPDCVFIISSDFCHWGNRFGYNFCPPECSPAIPLHQQIEQLDRQAMDAIERIDPDVFRSYLARTDNTICGRNPILLLLEILKLKMGVAEKQVTLKFIHYAQSSRITCTNDSSVSYAAAVVSVQL